MSRDHHQIHTTHCIANIQVERPHQGNTADCLHQVDVNTIRTIFGKCDENIFLAVRSSKANWTQSGISAQGAEILEFALTKVNLRGPNKRRMDGPTTLLYRSIVVTIH
ncbi:hypothetical protein GQX74_008289 [Glossina fuscipes]|nr:hypothetical protein GQX74_008289 [Glossina fuscipes]